MADDDIIVLSLESLSSEEEDHLLSHSSQHVAKFFMRFKMLVNSLEIQGFIH